MKNTSFLILFFFSLNLTAQKTNPEAIKFYESGESKQKNQDWTGSISDFNSALEISPNYDEAYLQRGVSNLVSENFKQAIEDCTKAIELNPDLGLSPYFVRGAAQHSLGNHEFAITDYSEALEFESEKVSKEQVYLQLATCRKELEDYEGALIDLSKAIELNPNYIDAYLIRLQILTIRDREDYTAAISEATKLIEIDSNNDIFYSMRGNFKNANGDPKAAIADFTKAIDINPNRIVTKGKGGYFSSRAFTNQDLDNHEEAIADFTKAIELSPEYWPLYSFRASSKYALDEYEGAIEDNMKSLKLKTELGGGKDLGLDEEYNNMGLAKEALKDYDGAIADFKKAISIDSIDPLNHHNLGNILLKTDQFEKAKSQFSIAERLDPSGKSSQYNSEGYYYPSVNLEKTEDLKFPLEVDIELFVEDIFKFDAKNEEFFLRFKYALYSPYPADYYVEKSDTIRRDITDLRETVKVDYVNSDQTRVDELTYNPIKDNITGHVYSGSLESTFYHNWDLRDYPFDKQKLQIRFKSSLDSTIFKFNASKRFPAKFNKKMIGLKDGFKIEEITFQNDYTNGWDELNLSPSLTRDIIYPIGTFNVIISRSGSWLFFKLFIGSFLAFLISWIVFTIPRTDFGSRIELSIGAIFGALGNKYFVESTTTTIQVLTKADLINNLVITMVFFNLLLILMQNNTKINFWKFEDSKFALAFSGLTMLISTIIIILI